MQEVGGRVRPSVFLIYLLSRHSKFDVLAPIEPVWDEDLADIVPVTQ